MGARSGGAWASNRGSNGFTINFTNYKTGRHQSIQTKAKSMAGAQKAASRIEKTSKGNLKWFSIEKNKPATGGAKSTPKAAAPKKSSTKTPKYTSTGHRIGMKTFSPKSGAGNWNKWQWGSK